MCGRFTLTTAAEIVADVFGVAAAPRLTPRYNIAPTQPVAVVRATSAGAPEIALLRWGLIPAWAKDPAIGNRMINARAETVADKPAFRTAFQKRRCLVPADGFYEWQKTAGGKRPFLIRTRDARPFALAGLWESWQQPSATVIESCTIITTAANALMGPIHDRMPVIVAPARYQAWLDPALSDRATLEQILVPYPAAELIAQAVTTRVNNPRNDDPDCLAPATDP